MLKTIAPGYYRLMCDILNPKPHKRRKEWYYAERFHRGWEFVVETTPSRIALLTYGGYTERMHTSGYPAEDGGRRWEALTAALEPIGPTAMRLVHEYSLQHLSPGRLLETLNHGGVHLQTLEDAIRYAKVLQDAEDAAVEQEATPAVAGA